MYVGYLVCLCVAVACVYNESPNDSLLALSSHAAFVVTSLYAYEKRRYDIAAMALIVTCTSLVWHSAGKFREVDAIFTRALAIYAFATTVASPLWAFAPAFLYAVIMNEVEMDLSMLVPLVVALLLYKAYKRTWTSRFALAVVTGGLGILCYHDVRWHSMWHVLGAVSVALTIEVPVVKAIVVESEIPELKLRF